MAVTIGAAGFLAKTVSAAEVFTVAVLGALVGLFPGLLMAGVFGVPLPLLLYICSVSLAHLSEYLFVCCYHPEDLAWDSFLIN